MSSALYVFWLYLALTTGGASGYPMNLLEAHGDGNHVVCLAALQDDDGYTGIFCTRVDWPDNLTVWYQWDLHRSDR